MRLGAALGRGLLRVGRRRRFIAKCNIDRCFPELSAEARQQLLLDHFAALGMALFEVGLAWWGSAKLLKSLVKVEGIDHLYQALQAGRGAILLGAHYTTIEIIGPFVALNCQAPIIALYRTHENPLLDAFIRKGRERHLEKILGRDEIKAIVRAMRQNRVIWFASDQNYGHKNSLFTPFFNIAAATNTSPSRLAKLSNAPVLPLGSCRLPNHQGYVVTISPPLEQFPTEDLAADMIRINQVIEERVRRCPEQYLWVHRRFKDRPPGEPTFYQAEQQDFSQPRHGRAPK